MTIHVVNTDETIYSIALKYNVPIKELMEHNAITNPNLLTKGQALLILEPEVIYQVEAGDSIFSIAQKFGITEYTLLQNNPQLISASYIYPGQTLNISYTGEPLGQYLVNGYVYPHIKQDVLNQTVPYLSMLSIFSYGFQPDGQLLPPDDQALLLAANTKGAAPILVLTPLDASGRFSNELVSQMLNNPDSRETLINNLLSVMSQKGYYGIDIDFEYVLPEDKEAFISFIGEVKAAMNAAGYKVFVALAPKTSAEQPGLLYEAHDYKRIGEIADYVFLMTYEWGFAYGPPMGVAPLNKVKEVLDYAITEIPPEKIIMGIPNYGYDWSLPFLRGDSKAISMGNQEAVQMAMNLRAEILYDELAQSPYFYYSDEEGMPHVVWFEDARSIDAKLRTASEYGFAGVGYWNIMRPFVQNWMLASNLYNIEKFAR
ncbi:glycosyl hydrolase family 18 protein [Anaerotignum sp. MB30-C6]|uniref:glycosyl hydrolase family 18 protein n=1 Tax=Anaerotignum sp. MB30-C6 TaxID=3070814 RepID=UPI0027DC9408|nr:glycosyl hydrolase family 18 protein [Anaerotignum sp. MB30-C6]WMI80721.1 glycosyl hydrolase family 18 protein [Anaerotignum sp. MB30-C6]